MEEKRESMPIEFALWAPRPRERTWGSTLGGRGPTIASRGSESEAGPGNNRLAFSGLRRDECLGEGDRSRFRRVFPARSSRGDRDRDRDCELDRRLLRLDLCFLRDRLSSSSLM